jgi:hypothetical protein
MTPITPTASFKDNLALLPSIEGIARIDLTDAAGTLVASIPNEPGKQGSLAVYNYLKLCFGRLDGAAAKHGLAVFGEHTPDALARPGAHPNIDRLLAVGPTGLEILVLGQ